MYNYIQIITVFCVLTQHVSVIIFPSSGAQNISKLVKVYISNVINYSFLKLL
jgi:hypothetical protein